MATIDFVGWDTHISQQGEYSQLTRNLRLLDSAVAMLKTTLGPRLAAHGRPRRHGVRPRGGAQWSGGTDHGTGGVAFIVGGAVRGGRVISD